MVERVSNLRKIDAPAGSGKSTEIKLRVREWADQHPNDKMLCITYTNRAADGLTEDLPAPGGNVDVSTIHSFLSAFAKPLFAVPEIVSLYFETYRDAIEARISNVEAKVHIDESNVAYAERLGEPLTFDLIRSSAKSLFYTESPFNSLYKGGLSHDDLLSFVNLCGKQFPAVYRRLSGKYQQIVIDEYQDTSAEVLDLFVSAVEGTSTSLHLYGDRMQQIYQPGSRRLKLLLDRFDVESRVVINYRSSPEIVNVLNNIYNDRLLLQTSSSQTHRAPRIHFTADPVALELELSKESPLILNVHNSTIFGSVGAGQLLKALQKMPEHSFNSRYPAVAVLTERSWDRVNNPLLSLLYGLLHIEAQFAVGAYGNAIQILKKYPAVFGMASVTLHADKGRLRNEFDELFSVMRTEEVSIRSVLEKLASLGHLKPGEAQGYLDSDLYSELLEVQFAEVRNTYGFNQDPKRSTQHGVKGEGHSKVLFVAETSKSTPLVHIDRLFNVWPHVPLNLAFLEDFEDQVSSAFTEATAAIGMETGKMRLADFTPVSTVVTMEAQRVLASFSDSRLFQELYAEVFSVYLSRENLTNAKNLFKLSTVTGLLAAYRLFYVGCSRAKRHLDVIVNSENIVDVEATKSKFRELGFDVAVEG